MNHDDVKEPPKDTPEPRPLVKPTSPTEEDIVELYAEESAIY
jgi:hypothetical protein